MILVSFYSAILFLLFLNDSFKTLCLYKTLDVNVLSKTVCEGTIKNRILSLFLILNFIWEKKASYADKCMSKVQDTIGIVKSLCEAKNYCSIRPDPNIYQNECIGVNKYLEVKYVCV